ncbi:hypothetical protein H4219_006157, partial [Mycoemilia scoparia]
MAKSDNRQDGKSISNKSTTPGVPDSDISQNNGSIDATILNPHSTIKKDINSHDHNNVATRDSSQSSPLSSLSSFKTLPSSSSPRNKGIGSKTDSIQTPSNKDKETSQLIEKDTPSTSTDNNSETSLLAKVPFYEHLKNPSYMSIIPITIIGIFGYLLATGFAVGLKNGIIPSTTPSLSTFSSEHGGFQDYKAEWQHQIKLKRQYLEPGTNGVKSTLVKAKHGAVAADDYRCSVIGRNILKDGGNAVDSAIGTALCIGVIQSFSAGIGGGGFMTIRLPDSTSHVIDFREEAPAAATTTMYYDNIALAQVGGLAVGVPGELAGLELAHRKFGKMEWKQIIQPSIELCRDGFTVSYILGAMIEKNKDWITTTAGFNETFVGPDGKTLVAGDTVKRPALAKSLEIIAEKGADAFYRGELTKSMVKVVKDNGGILTEQDFANYKAIVREPLTTTFFGKRIITPPPPTSGSILIMILNIIEGYNFKQLGPVPLSYHRMVEAFKWGYAQRTVLGDPAFLDDIQANVKKQTSKKLAAEIHKKISDNHTFPVEHYEADYDVLHDHGTSHLSVIDENEMAVALTTTVNLGFGSHLMDP